MKYILLNSKNKSGKYKYKQVGTIEASSLEVASSLVYKKFRREMNIENGETYIIVPYSENMKFKQNNIPQLDGIPFSVVQYRD